VKSTKKLPGLEETFVPGERESKLTRERYDTGLLDVEDKVLAELRRVASGS
jgi:LDH2 family malate/lactate/ureidoglycolate dehydrogenase